MVAVWSSYCVRMVFVAENWTDASKIPSSGRLLVGWNSSTYISLEGRTFEKLFLFGPGYASCTARTISKGRRWTTKI
jgi:hypothetical protein